MSITLPSSYDPRWAKFVTGDMQPQFLGARVMLGRLSANYRKSPDPATMAACCAELRGLYSSVAHLPKIQAEIENLFK